MTLRGRLLLVIMGLNLAAIGVVLLGSLWVQSQRTREQQEVYHRVLQTLLEDAFGPDPTDQQSALQAYDRAVLRWVRKLLRVDSFSRAFRDVLVTSGGPAGAIDVNPMGAWGRDWQAFPREAVRQGIEQAMRERRIVEIASGFCVPIEAGGQVAAGAWCAPVTVPTPQPFTLFAVPILISTLLTGVLAYLGLGRSLVGPLRRLGAAAARVGAGEQDVVVETVKGVPELNSLVAEFNMMAARVAGHTAELRREVQRATEETARRERALVVSSRLAAMGTLAAGLAHEINNPIGGMQNAVHRLAQRQALDERSKTYLELIREGLERVHGIARRVLDFSPRQLDAKPFSLLAAIDGARALMDYRLRQQGVELRVAVPADLPEIVGDRHEIQQVLLNFLLNSLDVLENQPAPAWIQITAKVEGDLVLVAVDDNGPGTDAETLARVLDPFFSAKGRPDATGLGLFISYSIIRAHGGDMEVTSAPGEGFHIRLRLPGRPASPTRDA